MREHRLPGASYPLSAASHLREHLLWMRRCGRSDRTLYARRRVVVLLAEFLGYDPLHASFDDLEHWQDHLLLRSTMHMRLSTALVRPYFGYLHARGYRTDDPARLLPTPRPPHRLPRPMTEDKVDHMLDEATGRVRCWLLIAGWMGLRAAEIAHMNSGDFFTDPHGQMWLRVIGKGDRQRDVPVPGWLWRFLCAHIHHDGPSWRRERGDGEVTAQHVSQLSNDYLHRVGIPDTFHSLRHRLATLTLDRSGGDLRLVQSLLGHAHLDTTALYTQVAPRRLARTLTEIPPPAGAVPPRRLHAVKAT